MMLHRSILKTRWSDSRSLRARGSPKTKDDLKKTEEAAEKAVDEAIGPPPAGGPAIAEDKD
jgi:hypothetical protein